MKYFIEVWLKGFSKNYCRAISKPNKDYFPHITFVRPFDIKPASNENQIKHQIISICENYSPIFFKLKGSDKFEYAKKTYQFIPVIEESGKFLQLNNDLETILEPCVNFVSKPNNEKIFHVTIDNDGDIKPAPEIQQYLFRLTIIRNKKIWFSYDFAKAQANLDHVLNREQSLDKTLWRKTVSIGLEQVGKKITPYGFVDI